MEVRSTFPYFYGLIIGILIQFSNTLSENNSEVLQTFGLFNDIGAEKRIIKDLLHNYDKLSRPRLLPNQAVAVLVDLIIIQFTELDGKKQVLNSNAWLRLSWKDVYLQWNSTKYRVPQLMLPIKKLWMPDLVVENSAASLSGLVSADTLAVVKPDGSIYVVFGDHVSTLCDLDLTYYPFDHQNCTIKISNWLSDDSIVRTRNQFTNIDYKSYQESSQWSVMDTQVKFTLTPSTLKNINFPAVEFHIQLKRKSFYHVMYMVLPSFILSLIALLMFWLPPESGEKVSLGTTVFLAFSVLMFSLSDDLPESSDSFPIIGVYLGFVMNITAGWLVLTVAILNLHNSTSQRQPPAWIQFIAFRVLSKVLCVDVSRTEKSNSYENETFSHEGESVERNEWKLLGRVFDRLCLYVFFIVDLTAFIVLLFYFSFSTLPHPETLPREESEWTI